MPARPGPRSDPCPALASTLTRSRGGLLRAGTGDRSTGKPPAECVPGRALGQGSPLGPQRASPSPLSHHHPSPHHQILARTIAVAARRGRVRVACGSRLGRSRDGSSSDDEDRGDSGTGGGPSEARRGARTEGRPIGSSARTAAPSAEGIRIDRSPVPARGRPPRDLVSAEARADPVGCSSVQPRRAGRVVSPTGGSNHRIPALGLGSAR